MHCEYVRKMAVHYYLQVHVDLRVAGSVAWLPNMAVDVVGARFVSSALYLHIAPPMVYVYVTPKLRGLQTCCAFEWQPAFPLYGPNRLHSQMEQW